MTAFALTAVLLGASPGVSFDLDLSAAYGFGSRHAFGGLAGVTAGTELWETKAAAGSLEFGFLAGYQAEPYALQAAWLPEAKLTGATHRIEALFQVGHGARLLSSRRLLIGVHVFAGWTHVVLRGAVVNESLGIDRQFAADAGRLTTGLSLTLGVRLTERLWVTARLLAPFPYASAVISYLIPTAGVTLRL